MSNVNIPAKKNESEIHVTVFLDNKAETDLLTAIINSEIRQATKGIPAHYTYNQGVSYRDVYGNDSGWPAYYTVRTATQEVRGIKELVARTNRVDRIVAIRLTCAEAKVLQQMVFDRISGANLRKHNNALDNLASKINSARLLGLAGEETRYERAIEALQQTAAAEFVPTEYVVETKIDTSHRIEVIAASPGIEDLWRRRIGIIYIRSQFAEVDGKITVVYSASDSAFERDDDERFASLDLSLIEAERLLAVHVARLDASRKASIAEARLAAEQIAA